VVEADFTFVFTVQGGKLAEWRIFVDESEALAATGPPE
jgi:ketosteroid isomerase-like protein